MLNVITLNIICNNDYSVQNDESLRGQATNERRVRKRDKKVTRCDLKRQQKMEREGATVTCDGRLFNSIEIP